MREGDVTEGAFQAKHKWKQGKKDARREAMIRMTKAKAKQLRQTPTNKGSFLPANSAQELIILRIIVGLKVNLQFSAIFARRLSILRRIVGRNKSKLKEEICNKPITPRRMMKR